MTHATQPGLATHLTTPWALIAGLVVLYGSAFLLIKVGVQTIPPLTLVTIRLGIGAAVLLAAMRLMGHRLPRLTVPGHRGLNRQWQFFLILGISGNVLPFALIAWGSQYIDSSLAGILMAIMPLTTMTLAALFVAGETITPWRLAGFSLGFVGMVVLFGPEALGLVSAGSLLAQLAMLAAAFSYSTNGVLTKNMPPCHPIVAAAGIHLCAVTITLPAAFLFEAPLTMAPSAVSLLSAILLGVFPSALATVMLLEVIHKAGPTFTSQINYLVPVWAVAMGFVFLGEVPGANAFAALAIILGGIALSQQHNRSASRSSSSP